MLYAANLDFFAKLFVLAELSYPILYPISPQLYPTEPQLALSCPTYHYLPHHILPISIHTIPSYPTLPHLAWSSHRSENQTWASRTMGIVGRYPKNRCSQWQSHRLLRYRYAGYNTTSPHWDLAYIPCNFCDLRFCDLRCRYEFVS